jgi:hypothetical protein
MAKQRMQTHENEEANAEPSRFIIKKYNAVVRSAELVDIRLISSKFDVKTEYFALKQAEEEGEKKRIKHGFGWQLSTFSYSQERRYMLGHLEWSATSVKGRKNLLTIKATYLVVYTAGEDLEEEYVSAFLSNVGRFATFPYFRSLVATYSAAASADLPLLPILKQPIATEDNGENAQE